MAALNDATMTAQTASAHSHVHAPREMKGADCVAECLIREGVARMARSLA